MRRQNLPGLLTIAFFFPVVTGFECNVVLSDPLMPGDACDATINAGDAFCSTDNTLVYCDPTTLVVLELDCTVGGGTCTGVGSTADCTYPSPEPTDLMPGDVCDAVLDAEGAYCTTEDTLVYCDPNTGIVLEFDCFADGATCFGEGANAACDYPWAEGNPCDWALQADEAVCIDTLNILQCSSVDTIVATNCKTYCESLYGATALTSASCGESEAFGYDACECTISTCTTDPFCWDSLYLYTCDGGYVNCDEYCFNDQGATKGVCDFTSAKCVCG